MTLEETTLLLTQNVAEPEQILKRGIISSSYLHIFLVRVLAPEPHFSPYMEIPMLKVFFFGEGVEGGLKVPFFFFARCPIFK